MPPASALKSRKAVATSKFYFFDPGLPHGILGTEALDRYSDLYGHAFEHFIALELRCFLSYFQKNLEICFFRTYGNREVDFVVKDTAIEVKAAARVSDRDIRNLKYLKETGKFRQLLLVSQDRQKKNHEGVVCLHWQDFLEALWQQKLL